MGVVVAARHVQLGSLVALKFMLPHETHVPGASERFLNEARAAARLRGEHVARVGDFGTLDTGAPYIVMEFLEGADLHAVVETRGPLPIQEAVGYVLDACKAMEEAHQAGIVHRDLKPKNLFLTHRHDGTPLVKVLDFGISKLTDAAGALAGTSTHTGAILGSPAFMSPEQMQSAKHVDARTDIYALGSVIFYLATKQLPFQAASMVDLFVAVLQSEPRPLRALRPDAPEALEAIVSRCLRKDPNLRFPNVRELMTALYAAVDPAGRAEPSRSSEPSPPLLVARPADAIVSASDGLAQGPRPALEQTTLDPASSTSRGHRSGKSRIMPWLIMAVALAGSLLVVVLLTVVVKRATRPDASATSDAPSADPAAASVEAPEGQGVTALSPASPATEPAARAVPPMQSATTPASSSKPPGRPRPASPPSSASANARPQKPTKKSSGEVFGTPD